MDINKSCKLVLSDVYSYDISQCHYAILESFGIDLSGIERDDKLKRNTQIGLMMRDNPRISTMLRSTTNSIIDEYLIRNDIGESELIVRAYDGFLTTKLLHHTDNYIPIELRDNYDFFIISLNRKMYLGGGKRISIKGVPHRYEEMDKLLNRIASIDFSSKETIFKILEKIKNELLISSNQRLYCIPLSNGKFNIFLKGYGETEISKSMIKILDADDIDRKIYFDLYLRSFCESIVLEYA